MKVRFGGGGRVALGESAEHPRWCLWWWEYVGGPVCYLSPTMGEEGWEQCRRFEEYLKYSFPSLHIQWSSKFYCYFISDVF